MSRIKRLIWTEDVARSWHRFQRSKLSPIGLAIVIFLVILAILAPYIAPYPEDAGKRTHLEIAMSPPSWEHPFGTDTVGRDIVSRVMIGTRISLTLGIAVLFLATSVGVTLGLIAGYLGGWIDAIIMRIADVFLAIPSIALAILVCAVLSPSLFNALIAISITWWPGYARLARGEVLSVKEEEFIEASRSLGASRLRIAFKDILPNIMTPVIVKITLDMGFAILVNAALGFLGLGAQEPTPEWGAMMSIGRRYLPEYWWLTAFPGFMVFLAVLGFNLVGDGLRDLFAVGIEKL